MFFHKLRSSDSINKIAKMGLNKTLNLDKVMSDLDILAIDTNIRKSLDEEFGKLQDHKERLLQIEDSLRNEYLVSRIRTRLESARDELMRYIAQLETKENLHFYVMETLQYIEQYKDILKTPIKVNFMGKLGNDDRKKRSVVNQYLKVASKYVDIDIRPTNPQRVSCHNCGNKKDFEIIETNTYVCTRCYATQIVVKYNSSYNDIDRVNISSKYMYDPKIHFRDCIKQYQGKQNCTIPAKVYEELEQEFSRHHLLCGDEDTPREERFVNVTKNHIMMFLKELGYSKHYENVHLIHYTITGKKPDDISHIEDQLLDDFDQLIDLYHKRFKHIKRKNFINTQYVLYQLIRRHRHECNKEEFIILKTIDRKFFHDEICKVLFEEKGWNHSPYF